MANFSKWLGAGLGFTLGGPIGSIIGFAVGSFVDGFSKDELLKSQEAYRQSNTQAGDFEMSLLVLASIVIKSDGKVDQRELDFVRTQFVSMYGKERANNSFRLFKEIVKKEVSAYQVCAQIRQHMPHASRLQLIHFLFGIAKADGQVAQAEVDEIKKIAGYLNVSQYDFESMKAMFFDSSDNAYKILEISKTASNDEIKKAYRKMAKKYHPDRLGDVGEAHLQGAKDKFLNIQNAYEKLKKERGMS